MSRAPIPRLVRAVAPLVCALVAVGAIQEPAPGDRRSVAIPGTEIAFEMVFVPGGVFSMGSTAADPGHEPDETPAHTVRLSGFWMTVHEVGHDAYAIFRNRRLDGSFGPPNASASYDPDAITRPSPPYEDPAHGMGKDGHPAVGMTRRAAIVYAAWLSAKTGLPFRLPTEAEWEYACRAGRESAWGFDAPATVDAHAWTAADVAEGERGTYRPLGIDPPNPWGLHDLQGNVAEWVLDSYAADAYERRADERVADPVVGEPPSGRGVVRGGSYLDPPAAMRCADREPEDPRWTRRDPQIPKSRWWNTDAPHVGFRLVSPVPPRRQP